ncbi:MAG: 2-oxo acid dehydrogenase subunit E2 [Deltaproteobacteria bacterium]|nr:2-oxo acid dehydrogenase subunit E2 [Deltaproteobacteria bacterium]
MATDIIMPKLSDTMEEGLLISWKKNPGEKVTRGDIIAEVETDKATMELEAFASGVLLEIRAKAGDVVPVGTVIGVIGADGEKPDTAPAAEMSGPAETKSTEPQSEKEQSTTEALKTAGVAKGGTVVEKASPMVRRLARDMGIELALVTGTGPEGRILQEDLENYQLKAKEHGKETTVVERTAETPEALENMTARQTNSTGGSEPISPMRAAIARTVTESWRSIPQFTVTADIDMGAAETLYKGFKDAGEHVSLNDIIIKAVATALAGFPRLNASWAEDRIVIHPEINVGIAVSVEDGLLVPVVRNCGNLTLRDVSRFSHELIERARTGKIAQGDMSGGTFTVSNLGMLGVKGFTAIILPPQSGILAIGAVTEAAVARGGHLTVARMMTAVLSADHRVVDGAYGAGFMDELKEILENPVRLLI